MIWIKNLIARKSSASWSMPMKHRRARGGATPLEKKIMTPSNIQNDRHPLRNGFLTPYPIELFKQATFFF